jgi:hypothetical protein
LDTRNGNIGVYDVGEGTARYSGALEALGKPLVRKRSSWILLLYVRPLG